MKLSVILEYGHWETFSDYPGHINPKMRKKKRKKGALSFFVEPPKKKKTTRRKK